jgi:hypothetical protein
MLFSLGGIEKIKKKIYLVLFFKKSKIKTYYLLKKL